MSLLMKTWMTGKMLQNLHISSKECTDCNRQACIQNCRHHFDIDNATCKMRLGLVSDTHGVYDQVGETYCSLCCADSKLRVDELFRL